MILPSLLLPTRQRKKQPIWSKSSFQDLRQIDLSLIHIYMQPDRIRSRPKVHLILHILADTPVLHPEIPSPRSLTLSSDTLPVSYTHLDVYKRQPLFL